MAIAATVALIWQTFLRFWPLCLAILLTYPTTLFASDEWIHFKTSFIKNGRVIDKFQEGISHSEGQGMALLIAVQNNDPEAFSQIWSWTQSNLQVRNDTLFAWSWSAKGGINDINNASDGDLFIAWALSRAYTKWNEPKYLSAAKEISQSIRATLLRKTSKGIILLPGSIGFEKPRSFKLNLSYWLFPAFTELAILDPNPDWEELRIRGLELINDAQLGKWKLPPDWLSLQDGTITPLNEARFGYDAVRIPLYLIWGKQANPENMRPFQTFWGSFSEKSRIPAWVNLNTGETAAYSASSGLQSIAALTLAYPNLESAQLPSFNPSQDYYSSMLFLLTKMALEDLKK